MDSLRTRGDGVPSLDPPVTRDRVLGRVVSPGGRAVQSVVTDKPYRFEALEEYVIELRAGKWLAVKAETTQQ